MDALNGLHGITFPYLTDRRSRLGDEFASLFVPVAAGTLPAARPRTPAPTLGATLVVLPSMPRERP
jgi:hypothetical protein